MADRFILENYMKMLQMLLSQVNRRLCASDTIYTYILIGQKGH